MKQAAVYIKDVFCGVLREDEEAFHFQYDGAYLERPDALGTVVLAKSLQLTDYQFFVMLP